MNYRTILSVFILLANVGLAPPPAVQAAAPDAADSPGRQTDGDHPASATQRFTVPPPVFTEGLFPCSNCHAGMKPDLRRRQLQDEHAAVLLRHAAGQIWCLDCHHAEDRDTLRLATGASLPFTESYRLCGQCHGEKLRDWQRGLHGRRTGHWNGDKHYLLCTGCHNPHEPAFKPLTPMPPPEGAGRHAR